MMETHQLFLKGLPFLMNIGLTAHPGSSDWLHRSQINLPKKVLPHQEKNALLQNWKTQKLFAISVGMLLC